MTYNRICSFQGSPSILEDNLRYMRRWGVARGLISACALILVARLVFMKKLSKVCVKVPHLSRQRRPVPICTKKRYLGDKNCGWVTCETSPPESLRGGIVYTIGMDGNINWEKEMIREYGTVHHGWDPAPRAKQFATSTRLPDHFSFHPFGLGVEDGSAMVKLPTGHIDSNKTMTYKTPLQQGKVLEIPTLTLESMMRILGHEHLAILKIDVEGGEFDILAKWIREQYEIRADQVLIEFHERFFGNGKMLSTAIHQMKTLGFNVFNQTKLVRNSTALQSMS